MKKGEDGSRAITQLRAVYIIRHAAFSPLDLRIRLHFPPRSPPVVVLGVSGLELDALNVLPVGLRLLDLSVGLHRGAQLVALLLPLGLLGGRGRGLGAARITAPEGRHVPPVKASESG